MRTAVGAVDGAAVPCGLRVEATQPRTAVVRMRTEVFHAMTSMAYLSQYAAVSLIVYRAT